MKTQEQEWPSVHSLDDGNAAILIWHRDPRVHVSS
jgi:hypothetical protein